MSGFLSRIGGFGDALGKFFGGTGGQLLGAGISLDQFNRLSDIGERAAAGQMLVGEEAAAKAAFKPFTVSTGFGGVATTPEGGYATTLSPQMASQQQQLQALTGGLIGGMGGVAPDVSGIQQQALGGVGGFLTGAMAPMAQREADVYERIRATQRPEEQRAQLALNERLAAQGRTGLRTAQFGGSPEQLALAQAQEEAKAGASLGAMRQAQAEQMQQMGLAESMFGLGGRAAGLPQSLQAGQLGNIGLAQAAQYSPEQQLLATLTPGTDLANIRTTAAMEGAGLFGQAGISGLEDLLQAESMKTQSTANILQQLIQAQAAQRAAAEGAGGGSNGGLFSDAADVVNTFLGIFRR
jgi:hypothetical protein